MAESDKEGDDEGDPDARCTSCKKAVGRCYPNNGIDDDYQYKRHDGRCLMCREPAPGEGHSGFMLAPGYVATVAELSPIMACLPTTTIAIIVEFITPQVVRPYTLSDYKEKEEKDYKDDGEEFVRMMNIRGVDFYTGYCVRLDLRFFRICRCPEWPCHCISEFAYAAKLSAFLEIDPELFVRRIKDDVTRYWFGVSLWEGWLECGPTDLCYRCNYQFQESDYYELMGLTGGKNCPNCCRTWCNECAVIVGCDDSDDDHLQSCRDCRLKLDAAEPPIQAEL